MGRYMSVVLKKQHLNDTFIKELNTELHGRFGAPDGTHFVSQEFVEEEAIFFKTHPEGLQQIPHFARPISKETLMQSFFWYRVGEFHCKISGGPSVDDARTAIAIAKWIRAT